MTTGNEGVHPDARASRWGSLGADLSYRQVSPQDHPGTAGVEPRRPALRVAVNDRAEGAAQGRQLPVEAFVSGFLDEPEPELPEVPESEEVEDLESELPDLESELELSLLAASFISRERLRVP